jgi:hypothetical protein
MRRFGSGANRLTSGAGKAEPFASGVGCLGVEAAGGVTGVALRQLAAPAQATATAASKSRPR